MGTMRRGLRIKAFRNFNGLKDGKPYATELILNEDAREGRIGGLIILIGPNNAGKSNVLDAVEIFNDDIIQGDIRIMSKEKRTSRYIPGDISPSDISDLYPDESCKSPCLILFKKTADDEDESYFEELESLTKAEIEGDVKELSHTNGFPPFHVPAQLSYDPDNLRGKMFPAYIKALGTYGTRCTITEDNGCYFLFDRNSILFTSSGDKIYRDESVLERIRDDYDLTFKSFIVPQIIRYTDSPIKSSELETDGEKIRDSAFYKTLFHATGTDIKDIIAAFTLFKEKRDKKVFAPIKDAINKGLEAVAQKFNRMYMSEKAPYAFEVDFDRQGLYLTLFHDGNAIVLDKQSTGFRYFFDLFFNLLNTTEVKPGDIIIMDEPATNLHVKGQRELRAFLKDFAVHNDITIIIATHSPFLIDTDNLDEIRLVVSDGTASRIENDFTAYDSGDPDSLLPIKEALTAENHIIVNPKETVVFVERMTAYCYLVAFKHLFGIKGITFLPIRNFGSSTDDAGSVIGGLSKIRSDAFILTEDRGTTDVLKSIQSDMTIMSLSDIDSGFSGFDSLFAEGDIPESASSFKNHIEEAVIADKTWNNFRKLFDRLLHEAE